MFFYRSTKFVMRHAVAIGVAIVALLLTLGARSVTSCAAILPSARPPT